LFRQITDQKEAILLLSYRAVCEYFRDDRRRLADWWHNWRRWAERRSLLELRLHEYRHPEAVFYLGMKMMVKQPHCAAGLEDVEEAAGAGDSWARYFLAMLRYRRDPADPQALEWIHGISGGPSSVDGRWESGNRMWSARQGVRQELYDISYNSWTPPDVPELLVHDPHVCNWEKCRRCKEGTSIIWYCIARCHIRHEFELWTRNFNERMKFVVGRM